MKKLYSNFRLGKALNEALSFFSNAKGWLFLFGLALLSGGVWGQTVGDYRTNATGTWSWTTTANWQRCVTNGTWAGATNTTYPGQNTGTGTVTIQDNTIVQINTSILHNIGALTISGGGNISYVDVLSGGILSVTGATTLSSNSNNDYKYVRVAGTFNTGSLNTTSGDNNARDSFLEITTGTATVSGNITMNTANANRNYILFSGDGTLKIGGAFVSNCYITSAVNGGASAPTRGNVEYYNSGGQTIWPTTYYKLTLSGAATKTLSNNTSVNNQLIVNAGATLNLSTFTLGSPTSTTLYCGATTGSTITGSGILTLGGNISVIDATTGTSGATISCPVALGSANRTFTVDDDGTNAADLTVSGVISGSRNLEKAGAGALTLSATNTFSLGTTLTAGTLNINNAQALGTVAGAFTINGGTINSTVGGITTLNYPQIWGNDFTFTGSQSLNLGAGVVTMASSRQITIAANTLTVGGILNSGTADLTKAGAGNLSMGAGAVTLRNLAISAGTFTAPSTTLNIGGDFSNAGTFAPNSGTVNFISGSVQNVGTAIFNNMATSGGGTKTLQGAVTVGGTLTLTSGILELDNYNLTITNNGAAAIVGTFGTNNMISTNGSGYLIKNAATGQTLYPIGSNGYYSPATINITAGGTTGTISTRAVPTTSLGTGFITKYWDVLTSVTGKTITANFTYSAAEGGIASSIKFKNGASWIAPPTGTSTFPSNYSATITGTTSITNSSTYWSVGTPNVYYTYQTGSWNTASTWTSDASGTTQVGTSAPGNNDAIVILSGRTVTLPANITTTGHDITVNEGGILDLSTYQFANTQPSLSGQGTIKIASSYFPIITTNNFITTDGGTTEFYNGINFNLPASQTIYNHLVINKAGATATQIANLTMNGNLTVKNGTYQLNNTTAQRLQLTINGDVTVNTGASLTTGTGVTNGAVTNPLTPTGSTGGYLNYYELYSHRVIVNGNFTNNGTVKFTNLSYPVFNAFPPTSGATAGFATVYFKGTSNSTLTCNSTTDFYNLVLDKGTDQTYSLTVQSTAYNNFRLFGANIAGGESGTANPGLKKALWIKTGTLKLQGLTIIPSLTEGTTTGTPASDFVIPANGALVLNGSEVIVLATADDYGEVNRAYGVSGGVGAVNGVNTTGATNFQGMVVYGKLQVNDGYLSTRESAGLLYSNVSSGQIELNGGVIDAKQIRENGAAGSGTSYSQSNGTLILRGRFVRPVAYASLSDLTSTASALTTRAANGTSGTYGTFNINNSSNVFSMSGGIIRIFDACGTALPAYVADIRSSAANTSVTGGAFEIIPTNGSGLADATPLSIYSVAAPLGDLTINRGVGCTSDVQLNTYPLTVLGNLTLTSGSLTANNLNVTVAGNFSISTNGTYTSGTNTTTFNGATAQMFTIDGAITAGLNNLAINKPAGTLTLAGTQSLLTVRGTFDLTSCTLADGGKTIAVAGNVTNSGTHTGVGKIQLNGTATQTIGGSGSGVFHNLELNNNNAATAPISLTANTVLNGVLTFSQNKLFNIGGYNLQLNSTASIANASTNRYIQTNGAAGDGGLTYCYPSSSVFTFPVGAPSTRHAAANYTPATIGFNGTVTTLGAITIIPVGYEHPATKNNTRSLTYFWRVKSTGFTLGSATVTHGYIYSQNDVVIGGDVTEPGYVAARYNVSSYTWTKGMANDVDDVTNNIIGEPGTGSFLENVNFIDGDYTAGDDNALDPFQSPTKYYSRQTGNWGTPATWSLTSHTVTNAPATAPGVNDVVIIGDNDIVSFETPANYLTNANTSPHSCASLQIEVGSVLDIRYNPASVLSMVQSHPNGNGKIKIAADYDNNGIFAFPAGDFTDFNQNLGTTELYSTNATSGTTFWLPNGISTYGNLMISPLGGSNIIFPNNDMTVYGNAIIKGQNADSWFCPTWDSDYPSAPTTRVSKTIRINGDLDIQGGSFGWNGNNGGGSQNVIVDGDVIVAPLAGIDVWSSNTSQSLSIGGSLINNSTNTIAGGTSTLSYVNLANVPVTFFGSTDASITNTASTPRTDFGLVTINKGTSQTTTVTCNIAGALNTSVNNWLTLQNGTFKYERAGDLNITTTSIFTIPATAGLYINTPSNIFIANSNANTNDLYLSGKLTLASGNVNIGPSAAPAFNNDIEYSGGGAAEIDVKGGNLIVNGQIRRNPSTSAGVLTYSQSGGAVTINGQGAVSTNAKLEILNSGSAFNMSGGTLTIVRGGGGITYGDLYIRPESSTVTGGTIILAHNLSGSAQTYKLDSNKPLYNLTITGRTAVTAANAQVDLMVNPLVLKGTLLLSNANSIFNTNNIDVTINGNLTNNGTTASYVYGTNTTTFNGNTQLFNGAAVTNFYNLNINPITSVTLNRNTTIAHDLTLSSGQLLSGTNYIYVNADVINNATYVTDDVTGGVVLQSGSTEHLLSGTGTFGRLELNDVKGARLSNDITLQKNFKLTQGILDINKQLLTLGVSSSIEGSGFGTSKMITSDGVFSNIGIRKYFNTGAASFIYPIGVAGKYTPANLVITANSNVGFVRINTINDKHPVTLSPYRVLNYYWEVESSGISGLSGNLVLNYLNGDVMQAVGDEVNYIAARLIVPGTSWSKAASGASTDNVNESANTITFTYGSTSNLSGEYTAGLASDIPDEVPVYQSNTAGSWSNETIWTPVGTSPACPAGGPNGFIVIIDHEVTADANNCFAYRTTINNKLNIVSPYYGHNLGTVSGNGTLYLESSVIPAGRYTSFFDCSSNSTLEYSGSGSYDIVADLYSSVPNLKVSGSGTKVLPNIDLTICKRLIIEGATLDNSAYNRKLTLGGTFERNSSGVFTSGSGSNATVVFAGTSAQTIGGATGNFNGVCGFNNLEVNNAAGLTIGGATEINGNLLLTSGLINTSSANTLTINNSAPSCVTPSGGTSSSYVNGPLVKKIIQGDSFTYPIGNSTGLGNKLRLSSTQTGTILWTAEYVTPNTTYTSLLAPLSYVNSNEYWNVSATTGSQAIINLTWDSSSDVTPLMTTNGLADMRVSSYNTTTSLWNEIASSATGDNNSGSVSSTARVTIPAAGSAKYTTATINTIKPKAKLAPAGSLCGANVGIPVTFTSSSAIPFNYILSYTLNSVPQTPVTVTAVPYTLPTTSAGTYKLTAFTYNNGGSTGVVDAGSVIVYDAPTTAAAGSDQSLCGATTATLSGNTPAVGTGLWSIISGTGGTVATPTTALSSFNGTNGSTYSLRWTISNGTCQSTDDAIISFPVLAAQPGAFTDGLSSVCQNESNVVYTVPFDASITSYTWSYSGSGAAISGTTNSVTVSFNSSATSGIISVTATNNCNTSASRTMDITVNNTTPVSLSSNDPDNSICTNSSVLFTATPDIGLAISDYEFFVNNVSVQSGATDNYNTISLVDGDVVNVVASNTDGCSSTSNAISMTILYTPGFWTGYTDTDWNTNSNWCSGSVPDGSTNVVVTNTTNKPIISGSILALTNSLTIDASAQLTLDAGGKMTVNGNITNNGTLKLMHTTDAPSSFINNGAISGNTTVTQILEGGRAWYLGCPMTSGASVFSSATPLNTGGTRSALEYNTTTKAWNALVTSTSMKGFSVNLGTGGPFTVTQSGLLHTGTQQIGLVTGGDAWNLLANPYPAYVDLTTVSSDWDLENYIQPSVYVRGKLTPASVYSFMTYNLSTGVGSLGFENGLIAPMQAFWVKASAAGPAKIYPEARMHPAAIQNLKSAKLEPEDVLRLRMSNAKGTDEAVMVFRSIGSQTYSNIDSEKKMESAPGVLPQFYSVKDGKKIVINVLPEDPLSYTIPLAMTVGITGVGDMTLQASNITSFMPDVEVYLKDLDTQTEVNLRENPTYTFDLKEVATDLTRFELSFKKSAAVVNPGTGTDIEIGDEVEKVNITAYALNDKAVVNISDSAFEGDVIIDVYDGKGVLYDSQLSSEKRTEIGLPKNTQVVIVKVTYKDQVKSFKLMKPVGF